MHVLGKLSRKAFGKSTTIVECGWSFSTTKPVHEEEDYRRHNDYTCLFVSFSISKFNTDSSQTDMFQRSASFLTVFSVLQGGYFVFNNLVPLNTKTSGDKTNHAE